ncbi:D-tyrosyl-tRNA(Tyr) deacylase 1 [Acipenser ruthenus]|uniref:Heme-binding protein 1 n=1 Tax=Acipenser ruthenus TaxID=7906 RepID=A0A662YZ50_ACIRT|nr:D-tyrosyl-tRNA(Tyr) deacylase 1 [Acipenser ruthenus]
MTNLFILVLLAPFGVLLASEQNETFEVRSYEASRWMTTEVEGRYMNAVSKGFMRLFRYIQGDNEAGQNIPMTAPVAVAVYPTADSTGMGKSHSVSFFIPPAIDPPKPKDARIHTLNVPAGTVYVRSFGGFAMGTTDVDQAKVLADDLKTEGLSFDETSFVAAGYDPPFRPINRHNEVWVRKILNLRLFDDENGKHWCKSVMDKQYEVLCVSQFTLQCILKGNKPDYHTAMAAEQSEPFYNDFLEHMRKTYKPEVIKDGTFGAYMQVRIQNDGPVTIELESPTGPADLKQQAKLEKQQQWKEKTRSKGPSESGKEKAASRAEVDPSTSSGAEGDVSSERES